MNEVDARRFRRRRQGKDSNVQRAVQSQTGVGILYVKCSQFPTALRAASTCTLSVQLVLTTPGHRPEVSVLGRNRTVGWTV